jgi:hypothetical protein
MLISKDPWQLIVPQPKGAGAATTYAFCVFFFFFESGVFFWPLTLFPFFLPLPMEFWLAGTPICWLCIVVCLWRDDIDFGCVADLLKGIVTQDASRSLSRQFA